MAGMADQPASPVAESPTFDDVLTSGFSNSTPKPISLLESALIEPGFQCKAPIASSGAAVPAPPIDRLTGPIPVRAMPCAWSELTGTIAARINTAEAQIRRKFVLDMARSSLTSEGS
ncbi:MAG: hypothetical protein FD138_2897 [Planctomycetota bacterium]|nr:MAG: hypothetical protein FD138_2897 [Planctomycetota bacterium]